MQTCLQTSFHVEKNLDNVVLSLRLRGADAARFWRIMDTAKAKNPYIDKSDVIRELIGLDPPTILSLSEIEHFRGEQYRLTKITPIGETKDERPAKKKRA